MHSFDKGRILTLILIILGLTIINGCKNDQPREINLEKREPSKTVQRQPAEKPLRIAVGGMITPREGFAYYRRLLDYIGEKLNRHVALVDRESYGEVNELLKKGEVDAAFVCGGPYVEGHKEFGLELLVAPVAYGEANYYSYIIVAKNSHINAFKDLLGKRFAFTDPLSNSGKLVPTYMLARMNETPDTFFNTYIFTNSHDKAIKAVAQGIVDGAAVDSLIWEYADRINPVFTSRTKIIEKSPPYGIPPVVVRPGLEPALKGILREIFLNMHNDKKGREILGNMMIDRFTLINDSAYDSIREMKAWVAEQESGKKSK
jgi:phosphonate transport system substrate-binding protein